MKSGKGDVGNCENAVSGAAWDRDVAIRSLWIDVMVTLEHLL